MSLTTFTIVLIAALLHATWNAVVRGGADKMLTTGLVTGSAALIGLVALPLTPGPARASWLFAGASAVLQILYFMLIARTYRVSAMSQAYPLMRGTAPLVVALVSTFLLHDPLAPLAWLGVAVICTGVISMVAARTRGQVGSVALSLLNAGVIASYTLVDGIGVRRSGAPAAYTLWLFVMTGAPLAAILLIRRRAEFQRYARANWRPGLVGGFGAVSSYGMALWAMTTAPIAVVAALRETSILFATAISVYVLKEKVSAVRFAGASILACGAIILRMA